MPKPTPCFLRAFALATAASLALFVSPAVCSADQPPSAPPDSSPPAPLPTQSEMAAQASSDEVVKMEAFNVSTSIGAYHEETSSMATKVPTTLKELASSLQILNASAISDRSAITLQDVYQYVVGLNQFQNNVNGFSFRGLSSAGGNTTQNIEYDGLQGSVSSKGALSAANVEEVEFLKGPNSVLYGSMKPGGLLNIVTKSPMQVQQTSVRLAMSTFATGLSTFGSKLSYYGTIDTTGPIDKGGHWLYRMIVSGNSLQPFPLGDHEKDLYVYPSLTYQWSEQTYFTVKIESIREVSQLDTNLVAIFSPGNTYGPTASYTLAPFNTVYQEPGDSLRNSGEGLSANFHTQLGDKWTVRAQTRSIWHTDSQRGLATNGGVVTFTPLPQNATIRRQYNYIINGHRYNMFDVNAVGVLGPERLQNTVVVGVGGGAEYYNNERLGFGPNVAPIFLLNPVLGVTARPADGTKVASPHLYTDSLGEYISDQMRIGERLHLTLGTRHDQVLSHSFDVFNPATSTYVHQFSTAESSQAGAVIDLTKELSAYGSWSQSFLPAAVTTVDINGISGFPPEKGRQYEAGFKFETPRHDLFASVAAYDIARTNVALATGQNVPITGQSAFRLDGEQISRGVEFETEWQPIPYWQIQAGMAYSKAYISQSIKNPQTVNDDLANAPRKSGNFWTRYNVPGGRLKGLGIGVGVIYVGKQWGGDPSTANYFIVPGWTRVDTAFFYKWRNYDFSLNVRNVLDRQYILAAQNALVLIPGEPRKFTFSVTTHF